MSQFVTITVFDDGNTQYKYLCDLGMNKWKITNKMFNGSKVELINMSDKKIKVAVNGCGRIGRSNPLSL